MGLIWSPTRKWYQYQRAGRGRPLRRAPSAPTRDLRPSDRAGRSSSSGRRRDLPADLDGHGRHPSAGQRFGREARPEHDAVSRRIARRHAQREGGVRNVMSRLGAMALARRAGAIPHRARLPRNARRLTDVRSQASIDPESFTASSSRGGPKARARPRSSRCFGLELEMPISTSSAGIRASLTRAVISGASWSRGGGVRRRSGRAHTACSCRRRR